MTELDLRETLERRIGAVPVPPGDPGPAIRAGRRQRRRRHGMVVGVVAAAVVVAVGGVALLTRSGPTEPRPVGPTHELDFSHGARAYGEACGTAHVGGQRVSAQVTPCLFAFASVATQYGVVFFEHGRPMLLDQHGEVRALVNTEVDEPSHPFQSVQADAVRPYVAWSTIRSGVVTLTLHDLATGTDVRTTTLPCPGRPCGLRVVAVDDGDVVVSRPAETLLWTEDGLTQIAGGSTQVRDLRAGVMLYHGPAPQVSGYRMFAATTGWWKLTFDGRYVLTGSSRLASTEGGPPIILDRGPSPGENSKNAVTWYGIDSDGSVLMIEQQSPGAWSFMVRDCELPSGHCTDLGVLKPGSGDPSMAGDQ